MTRLLSVEWLRLRSRRVFWIVGAAVIAGLALSMFSLARDARPPSASALANAQHQADLAAQDPGLQQAIDDCISDQASGDGALGYPPGFDCQQLRPTADNFLNATHVSLVNELRDGALGVAGLVGLAALIIGVTFMSADWSAGTIGTQLLYEPRRRRVYLAKVVAAAAGGAAIAVVAVVFRALGLWAIASTWGTTHGFGDAAGSLALQGLRTVALISVAGAVGVALVSALRHSTAVLGLVVVYLFFGEGLLRQLWDGVEPWLLTARVAAWIQGSDRIEQYHDCGNSAQPCVPDVTVIGLGGSAAYLAILCLLGAAVTLYVFQRRDVA